MTKRIYGNTVIVVSDDEGGGGGGPVSDHGDLTGLSDDDHIQYHTDARGDARYYTQAQVDSSLAGKANSVHTHAIADTTGLQAALDGKSATGHSHAISDVTSLQSSLDAKAPLASPTLTGTPTAPTAAGGTNTTQLATTAFVTSAIATLLDSPPGALDTLNELAAALGDDANFAATMTTALAGKQPIDATLTALAGAATGADKLAYFSAVDTVAVADLTAAGRALLDDADASAQRTTLGLGSAATANTGDFAASAHNHSATDINTGTLDNARLSAAVRTRTITFVFGDGTNVIEVGNAGYLPKCPFSGTIKSWRIIADAAGDLTLDVWKSSSGIPTNADSITASAKPSLSDEQEGDSSALTGWTTSVSAGDRFGFEVESATTIKRATLVLEVEA